MKFKEFLEVQASLLPAINFAPGMPAFYDVIRLWNAIAVILPEKAEDVVVWEKGGMISTMANDLDLTNIKIALGTKRLENLPDNMRTTYKPQYDNKKKEYPKPKIAPTPEKVEKAVKEVAKAVETVNNEVPVETAKDEEGLHVPDHAKKAKKSPKSSDKVDV